MTQLSSDTIRISDLRELSRRRLPKMVFDYIDGGAGDELTMAANERVFDDIFFRPRSARKTPTVETKTSVLGQELKMPMLLAPVGSSRLFWPRGEAAAASAASKAGLTYILSTFSGMRLEEVREACPHQPWYQLYLAGGRDAALDAMNRARQCGFRALVVTIDTPVAGNRERDIKNGITQLLSKNLLEKASRSWQVISRPAWLLDFMRDGGLMEFPNIVLPDGPMSYGDIGAQLGESAVTWSDLAWIKDGWGGPVVVKGVHTADDARQAVDSGAEAIVVSNHGGRQLDGVSPSLRVLPEVVAAVGNQVDVMVDGGIRRGAHIVKALALGAKAVLIGRAYAYGLGAAGETGVSRAIDILQDELVLTLKLLGISSIHDLSPEYLELPDNWRLPA